MFRLYRLMPDEANWGKKYKYEINATHKWGLPGVICPTCKATWGIVGVAYPGTDLAGLPTAERYYYRNLGVVALQEFEELRRPLLSLIADASLLPPGTDFGPLVGKAKGRFGDFAWLDSWTLLIQAKVLALLSSQGIQSLEAVPTELTIRSKEAVELLEVQLPPTLELAAASLPPDGAPPCPACGRRGLKKPEHIVIRAASIPPQQELFRSKDLPTFLFATEKFATTVQALKLTDITFQEVEVEHS